MAEIDDVRWIGERIGYGNLMHLAQRAWRQKLTEKNMQGGEFAVGCCTTFVVKCPCPEDGKDANGHCDWCCGSGWVTKKVLAAMEEARK